MQEPLLSTVILITRVPEQLTLIGAVGGEAVGLLQGAKMDLLGGLALPVEADRLHLYDVVRLLLQVPKDTRAARGVHFSDEPLRVSFLPLGLQGGHNNRSMRVIAMRCVPQEETTLFSKKHRGVDLHSIVQKAKRNHLNSL